MTPEQLAAMSDDEKLDLLSTKAAECLVAIQEGHSLVNLYLTATAARLDVNIDLLFSMWAGTIYSMNAAATALAGKREPEKGAAMIRVYDLGKTVYDNELRGKVENL